MADDGKTTAEELQAALPSWCEDTCARIAACPTNGDCGCPEGELCECTSSDPQACPGNCQEELGRWAAAGEQCAAVGRRRMDCYDGVPCGELNQDDPCPPTEAERAACDDSEDDPPTATSSGPNGGTSQPPSRVDVPSIGALVSCREAYGSGGGIPASGGTYVTCETGASDCSDGHEYRVICVANDAQLESCSCFRDATITGAFDPQGTCPNVDQVNNVCGWQLAPL